MLAAGIIETEGADLNVNADIHLKGSILAESLAASRPVNDNANVTHHNACQISDSLTWAPSEGFYCRYQLYLVEYVLIWPGGVVANMLGYKWPITC